MKILSRTQFGNPILRSNAASIPLKFLKTAKFKKLIKAMIYTMRHTNGVGLAAPQVGLLLKLVVIETRPTPTRPSLKQRGPIVIVNASIIQYSKEKKSDWEGCLSFSGNRGKVPRSKKITVRYFNEYGKKVIEKASGLWARIFQHEIDHLNGIVYVDRMKDMKTLMTPSEFKKRVLK